MAMTAAVVMATGVIMARRSAQLRAGGAYMEGGVAPLNVALAPGHFVPRSVMILGWWRRSIAPFQPSGNPAYLPSARTITL